MLSQPKGCTNRKYRLVTSIISTEINLLHVLVQSKFKSTTQKKPVFTPFKIDSNKMGKHTIKGAGGQKPLKYGEKTVTVFGRRVPKSQEGDYRAWYKETCDPKIDKKLKTYIKKPKGKQS